MYPQESYLPRFSDSIAASPFFVDLCLFCTVRQAKRVARLRVRERSCLNTGGQLKGVQPVVFSSDDMGALSSPPNPNRVMYGLGYAVLHSTVLWSQSRIVSKASSV